MPFNLPYDTLVQDVLPMGIIFLTVLVSIRLTWIILNREKFVLYKELIALLFVIYIMLLFWVVTFFDDNYGLSNFVPFTEIFRHDFMTYRFIKHNFGNILMFMPYALFLGYYLKTNSWKIVLALSGLLSLVIELTQKYIVGRAFDIDDILLNMLGAYLGWLVYSGISKMHDKLPGFTRSEWFLNALVVIVLTVVVAILIHIFQNTPSWMLP